MNLPAQDSKKDLQKKKEQLKKEIQFTNKLLNETKEKRNISLNQLVTLNKKISIRQELINTINDEIVGLNRQIAQINMQIEALSRELEKLKAEYASRGVQLVEVAGKWRFQSAPDLAFLFEETREQPRALSKAALETLAIVAYRQQVTRGAVERIRGVDSDYTIRTLLHRRLIVELGRSEAPGRPFLYGTDFEFLERFGMSSLDQLPPLDEDVAARLLAAADAAAAVPDPGGLGDPTPGTAVGPGRP